MAGEEVGSSTSKLCEDIAGSIEGQLLPLVYDAVTKFESKLLEENKDKDRQLQAANARIARLEEQLKAANQVRLGIQKALDASLNGKEASSDSYDRQSHVPLEQHQHLEHKVDALTKQLNESKERQRTEAQARHLLINKLRTAKSTAREWMLLAEKRDPRKPKATPDISFSKPLPPSPGIEDLHSDEILNIAAVGIRHSLGSLEGKPTAEIPQTETVDPQNANNVDQFKTRSDQDFIGNIPSSKQDTLPPSSMEAVTYDMNRVIPDSDEEPVIIEERPVKRRRKTKQRTLTNIETTRIKQEIVSPEQNMQGLETLDLDMVGEHLITPRRQKVLEIDHFQPFPQIRFESPSSDHPRHQRLQSHQKSKTECLENENVNPYVRSQYNARIFEDTGSPSPIEEGRVEERQILAPVDVNIQSRSKKRERRRSRRSIEKVIHMMCEDEKTKQFSTSQFHVPTPTAFIDTSLQALLNGEGLQELPAQKLHPPFNRIKTPNRSLDQLDSNNTVVGTKVQSSSRPSFSPKVSSARYHAQLTQQLDTHSSPQRNSRYRNTAKRLRDRSKESLTISDFKINPKLNSGLDFAFGEAVYGESRKCYPGCTDSRCCGDAFRVLASTLKPTLPRPAIPGSQEDANLTDDEFLLKWHMGGTWNVEYVRNMGQQERERLLLDARTRLLAERHGKHRIVGERRMTPPGYWDMDMPSTQDIELQRREAERIMRQMVEERYKEAVRSGKWLFADE